MNYNIILFRCGFSPENFKVEEHDPIITNKGIIYPFNQATNNRICPYCGKENNVVIHDYYYSTINVTDNSNNPEYLRIKKVRFTCKSCNLSFVPELKGIAKRDTISSQTKRNIYFDFRKLLTFKQIANNYCICSTTVINLFDELVPNVNRNKLERIMCIDEFKFSKNEDQKYCTVITNFSNGKIIDVLKNRKLEYLKEYFSSIDETERESVQYFVSDMYDPYSIIKKKYFPNSIHVIDLFHIVKQLTSAINGIRIKVMKELKKGSAEANFLKKYWKLFLGSRYKIPYKTYTHKKTNITYDIHDLFEVCLKLDKVLLEAYEILQDILLSYNKLSTNSVNDFIDRICENLDNTENKELKKVSSTYKKWKLEISNALLPNTRKQGITNGKAEGNNNYIKTLIKISYGCNDYERTRKRILILKK